MSPRPPAAPARGRPCRGASLIEVLVAVLILSLGLLGLAALQARALKGNISSVQRTQAVMLTQYMMDLMRVDHDAARSGAYNTGGSFKCASTDFASTGLAQTSLGQWLASLKSQVGQPNDSTTCVQAGCTAAGLCRIEVRWDDSASGGLPDQSLAMDSRL